jgi:NADPH:quinone reductase-like Zn-dependent oxidoreductase
MKAVVYTEYGSPDVLHLTEVAKPTPKEGEILVRVRANSVNFGDLIARKLGKMSSREFYMPSLFWLFARMEFGFRKPKKYILGNEFAGEVEAVGKNVTRFKIGDAVFGFRSMNMGANAEYMCVPENTSVAHKPANVTNEEAAAIPGGALTALNLLRKVNIQPGQKVLINGASGGIGAAALQLAKYYGAEVTAVCGTGRVEMVKALGADKMIDYTKQDFTQSSDQYDLIVDILGKGSFVRAKRVLRPDGRYLYASFKLKQVFQMLWTSKFGSRKVICALALDKPDDILVIKELIEAGKLKAVVDRCYRLEQAADAHRYMESGNRAGSVVLVV